MQFEPDAAFPPRRPRRGWGGRRRGAGARPGNVNALKHGRYSRQMAQLTRFLTQEPGFRRVLARLARAPQNDQAGNDQENSPPANVERPD